MLFKSVSWLSLASPAKGSKKRRFSFELCVTDCQENACTNTVNLIHFAAKYVPIYGIWIVRAGEKLAMLFPFEHFCAELLFILFLPLQIISIITKLFVVFRHL